MKLENAEKQKAFNAIHPTAEIGEGTTMGFFNVIHEGVRIGENCDLGSHIIIKAGTVIGDGVKIDSGVQFSGAGTTVGDGATIRNNSIICRECTIGSGVFISPQVMTIYQEFTEEGNRPKGGIRIGDAAHIGTNATIGAGVKIGANAWVGAKALVLKDVPEGETVKGIPAK
jgi:acetyltransferase-like isoleucine patch superfamily enzyme